MVVTRSKTSASKRRSTFALTWSGTSRGQGQYEFECMSKQRPVYSHVTNKQYVVWNHKTEWLFGKRSELNKDDPDLFAWCADKAATPLDIRSIWKILDVSNMQWVDCLEFNITSIPTDTQAKAESSDAEKDYSSYRMTKDEEAQVTKRMWDLKKDVDRNARWIKEYQSNKGSVEDPRNTSHMVSLEKRLYKLEKEELERTSKLVKRVEAACSTVHKICKQSRRSLKKEELKALKEFDMLKYTTMKKLKDFLRVKKSKDYFVRGYGYIKLTGTKATIAKRVKRVLDQMEKDADLSKTCSVNQTDTEEKNNGLIVSPSRKRRKMSYRVACDRRKRNSK